MPVSINGSGAITFNDGSIQNTAATGFGFKNRIINGDMRIDQRNAGASVTNSTGIIFTLDRWAVQTVGSTCSIQQVTGSTGNNRAMRITGASGNSNTLASQKIEATNIYDCAGQSVTVSFTISGSSSGSVSVRFLYPTATDNYTSTTEPVGGTTVNFTTTPTRYTVTRTLDANANKGLWLVFERGATGAGVTWTLEDVQLEKGSTATSFDYRPYGTELALCQRYYEQSAQGNDYIWTGYGSNGSGYYLSIPFKVEKRATPTITVSTPGTSAFNAASLGATDINTDKFNAVCTANATAVAGFFYVRFRASSEL